jgi:hypothetical protein
MKDVLLAEWTGLLDRIKTWFGDADLDEFDQEIRAALIGIGARGAVGEVPYTPYVEMSVNASLTMASGMPREYTSNLSSSVAR